MSSRNKCSGTLFGRFYIYYIYFYKVAFTYYLSVYLFGFRKDRYSLTQSQGHTSCSVVDLFYSGGNYFLKLTLELCKSLSLFAVADTLSDNVSCSLNGNSAEVLRIQLYTDLCSKLGIRIYFSCNRLSYLAVGVLYLSNNGFIKKDLELTRIRLHCNGYVVVAVIGIFACGNYSLLYLSDHKVYRYTPFFFYKSQSLKQFGVFIIRDFWCFFLHLRFSPLYVKIIKLYVHGIFFSYCFFISV